MTKNIGILILLTSFLFGVAPNGQFKNYVELLDVVDSRIKTHSSRLRNVIAPIVAEFDLNSSEDIPILVESASSVLEQIITLRKLIVNILYAYHMSDLTSDGKVEQHTYPFLNIQKEYLENNIKMYKGFKEVFLTLEDYDGFDSLIDINDDCIELSETVFIIAINIMDDLDYKTESFQDNQVMDI